MKVTQNKIRRLVQKYRQQLKLGDWDIEISLSPFESLKTGTGDGAYALSQIQLGCKKVRMQYDVVSIESNCWSCSLEEIVAHEVVHIMLVELGYDNVLFNAQESDSGFKVAYEVQESLCDRMARALVDKS